MTNQTEQTKQPMLETKAKQSDGSYKHFSAPLALPASVEAFEAILSTANDELKAFIMDCAALGCMGKARNHLLTSRLNGDVNYQNVLDAQNLAAESRGAQGEGMKRLKALCDLVVVFAQGEYGLGEKAAATLRKLLFSTQLLELASEKHKARVLGIMEAAATSWDDETLEEYDVYISRILDACNATAADDDAF